MSRVLRRCSQSLYILTYLVCSLASVIPAATAGHVTHPYPAANQTSGSRPVTGYAATIATDTGRAASRGRVAPVRAGTAIISSTFPITTGSLRAIAASPAGDVWVVGCCQGTQPLIAHWTGRHWDLTPAAPTAQPGGLRAIAALSARDAWAVGDPGSSLAASSQAPLIEHWDGTRWRVVASPPVPRESSYFLQAVAATSTRDVWAAGTGYGGIVALVEHWDGTRWRVVPTPTFGSTPLTSQTPPRYMRYSGVLAGLAALSGRDAWAVGSAFNQAAPLIEHWDGAAWKRVASPTVPDFGIGSLAALAALSPRDIWAVGRSTTICLKCGGEGPVLLHWDGTRWRLVRGAPLAASRGDGFLTSVAATSTRDVWAVGGQGARARPLIEHWDGARWQEVPSPALADPQGDLTYSLAAVAAVTATDAWAVGTIGRANGGFTQPLIEHWDGRVWHIIPNGDAAGAPS